MRVALDFLDAAAVSLVSDWVCEVLSDSTRAIERMKKQRIYHRAGVSWVWPIDPDARTFEVFRREGEHWALVLEAGNDEEVRAARSRRSCSTSGGFGRRRCDEVGRLHSQRR